jgi:CPA2 family monovalent cation:H+ antiporter-2
VLVGVALALSSTAIVIPVLSEQKRLGSPTGRASFAVLLFQDLAVAPVLFTITCWARAPARASAPPSRSRWVRRRSPS